jgi:hypothetical protein
MACTYHTIMCGFSAVKHRGAVIFADSFTRSGRKSGKHCWYYGNPSVSDLEVV